MSNDPKNIKIVLLGETGCGKTSLINRFVHNTFDPYQESTIGANYYSKTLNTHNTVLKLNLWDTTGKEKYEGIASLYAKQADAFLIVCQCNQESPSSTITKYIDKYIKENQRKDTQVFIVINKIDMRTESSSFLISEIEKTADELQYSIFKVSAKDGTMVNEMFEKINDRIYKSSEGTAKTSINLKTSAKMLPLYERKKSSCC